MFNRGDLGFIYNLGLQGVLLQWFGGYCRGVWGKGYCSVYNGGLLRVHRLQRLAEERCNQRLAGVVQYLIETVH